VLQINIPALFLIPADAMAEFLPNPDESSVRIYVPGPPTFILDGQTTFQLIWAEYLTYRNLWTRSFDLLILHRRY